MQTPIAAKMASVRHVRGIVLLRLLQGLKEPHGRLALDPSVEIEHIRIIV